MDPNIRVPWFSHRTPGVAFFYGSMVAKAVLNMLMLEVAALSVTMII